MFQSFEDISDPARGARHIKLLRQELLRRNLAGFLVPRTDEHQGEYVPACAERLAWLTGFTGSAGLGIVLGRKAALFVDGRYTLQAAEQTDEAILVCFNSAKNPAAAWLEKVVRRGERVGFDARLHTPSDIVRFESACKIAGAKLIAIAGNPVDRIWTDRPAVPKGAVSVHPLKHAGQSAAGKLDRLAQHLTRAGHDAALLTLPDSIAWAFNMRGSDIAHTPVALCHAIIAANGRHELFIDPDKLGKQAERHLEKLATISAPDALDGRLKALGSAGATVGLDRQTASVRLERLLTRSGAKLENAPDPCLLPKAKKNTAEINGARAAHRRDGAALSEFLAWLDRAGPRGAVDEISAATKLETIRAAGGSLKDISFPSISAAGPHGAVVHYKVSENTNAKLAKGTLYLIDSGGQYVDGTTDVTRTIALGMPASAMKRHFTLVLKGHIALARARFSAGTTGAHLDALARLPLWRAGLDFDHGSGHGVGSYLSVHEGPQRISKTGFDVPLEPGMILSNEPGYYRSGKYGIRIENLLLVERRKPPHGGERDMLGFETLTLAPIDRKLVDPKLMDTSERNWLNHYHKRVFKEVEEQLKPVDRRWLEKACRPV